MLLNRPLALLLAASVLLAGCSGGDGAPQDPRLAAAEQAAQAMPAEASASTGVIRGVVLDGNGNPVAGATVTVTPPRTDTTTTAEGAFAMGGLEPGRHLVRVHGVRLMAVEDFVEVAAGDAHPAVELFVVETIEVEASVETREAEVKVSTRAGDTGVINHAPGAAAQLTDFTTIVQFEYTWEPFTSLTETLTAFAGFSIGVDERVTGTSPLVLRLDAGKLSDVPDYVSGGIQGQASEPVVVGEGQTVHVRIDVFNGFVPDADWTFGKDGPYPAPSA